MQFKPAKLVLATGEHFTGQAPLSQSHPASGEVVFNTGMTGYVETLTDPSYAGQIVCFTYPLIGNYGVAEARTWESKKIHARGVIMANTFDAPSHYASHQPFFNWLAEQNIPCLTGVDTRALTLILREQGVALGAISDPETLPLAFDDINALHLVREVSICQPEIHGHGPKKIIAVDCGMKENILRELLKFPITVKRVPYNYDYTEEDYDGLFLSNGPGDPAMCTETIAILAKALLKPKPLFGICLGIQLLALAIGAKTYKLPYGHRGQNQPCIDLRSQKALLTSQNHGYAVQRDSLPPDWQESFRHLNDGTVQGIEHRTLPYFAVQFHPEASPGPHDAAWLFEKFYQSL